jgi:hypothetical protein
MNELLMLYLNIQRRKVRFANNSLFFLISEVTIEEEDIGNGRTESNVYCVPFMHRRVYVINHFFREAIGLIVSDIILLEFYYLLFTRHVFFLTKVLS